MDMYTIYRFLMETGKEKNEHECDKTNTTPTNIIFLGGAYHTFNYYNILNYIQAKDEDKDKYIRHHNIKYLINIKTVLYNEILLNNNSITTIYNNNNDKINMFFKYLLGK